jgi:ParB-like chromosome segregation protein Spo0J
MHGNSTRTVKSATSKQRKKPVKKPVKKDPIQKVRHARLLSIKRSPENDKLYRPVDPTDPDIVALAESIRQHGIREPLIITADGFIVSGHRRSTAARLAGLKMVPVIQLSIRRLDDVNGFVRLLREHNRQRDKTNAEKLREEVVSINPAEAYTQLRQYRRSAAVLTVTPLDMGDVKFRKSISAAKQPMLDAIEAVIEARREFWPLSDRQIHYALLNDPPLRHAAKPYSRYQNDRESYNDLTDLVTRARLERRIPFEAIGDETRPIEEWQVYPGVSAFVREQMGSMFRGYWRNLMQSQPNHLEIVVEKNTIRSIVAPVAEEYAIPTTSGRGYCSLPPRYSMLWRYKASGKQKLVVLLVGDFDPEGEDIAHSFARSMRDDFHVFDVHPIKVALTAEQVLEYQLPPILQAKKTSSRYAKFVELHGTDVFEVEAVPPKTLQQILRSTIEAVIDREAFDAEIAAERDDAAFLEGVRRTVNEALRGAGMEGAGDE